MEHAKALLTWIWTNLVESTCASGQALPVTSEQPNPGEKSPPQVKTSALQKQLALRSPVSRHLRGGLLAEDF